MNNTSVNNDRRTFIKYAGLLSGGLLAGTIASKSAAQNKKPFYHQKLAKSTLGNDDIAHLVNRTSFGITPEMYDIAQNLGYEAFLDWQLNHEAIDDSELEAYLAGIYPTLAMSVHEITELVNETGQPLQPFGELIGATVIRAILSPKQLFETMVGFWNNHFTVNCLDGPVSIFKNPEDRLIMREHALGKFGELLQLDAKSPAMLFYLDNYNNTVSGPNENYARELMELHTLGVDGGYTEADVLEVARCFTGWTISQTTDDFFLFFSDSHDFGEKTVLGQTIPAGQGVEDGEQVLDILAHHESTAKFISHKLAVRFVSDTPSENIVGELTDIYQNQDGDIKAMMRHLLLSDEFLASKDQKVKQPMEYVVSAIRSTRPQLTNRGGSELADIIQDLGQPLFHWATPDGFPDNNQHWVNTSSLLVRWNMVVGLADNTFNEFAHIDIFDFIESARTPGSIVDILVQKILSREITKQDRWILIDYAAEGKPENAILPITLAAKKARGVMALIMTSHYFQLR